MNRELDREIQIWLVGVAIGFGLATLVAAAGAFIGVLVWSLT